MELWIRSQDKCKLKEAHLVRAEFEDIGRGKWRILGDGSILGTYRTKERCIEIIDEIQNLMMQSGTFIFENIDVCFIPEDYFKPYKVIMHHSQNEPSVHFYNPNSFVYEMPQE